MDIPVTIHRKISIRYRATAALNEQNTERARELAQEILADPAVDQLIIGVRRALQRLLVETIGDRPKSPVRHVFMSTPSRLAPVSEAHVPPPTTSPIRSNSFWQGGFHSPIGLARNGIRGK